MARSKRNRKLNQLDEHDLADGINYDPTGRMKYNPEFHPNHGKPFTLSELIYLCKFYEIDGAVSMGHALGKTPGVVQSKAAKLKASGRFDQYKNMSDEAWERILLTEAASTLAINQSGPSRRKSTISAGAKRQSSAATSAQR